MNGTLLNRRLHWVLATGFALALTACSSSGSSSAMPAAANASVRFAEGSPLLETLVNGVVQPLGSSAFLQVGSRTVASLFTYGTLTPFAAVTAGVQSLYVRNDLGYAVGPLKTASLAAGKRYTLIVVGTYPNYSALTFEEPASNGDAQLSLYEASPTVPQSDFGSFRASSKSDFKQLGSAKLGEVVTVTVGKSVTDFGGYTGAASKPTGSITLSQINGFDKHNTLPFHAISRLSLFLFDYSGGDPPGPLFGSLDE
jgi:hypothetical protein